MMATTKELNVQDIATLIKSNLYNLIEVALSNNPLGYYSRAKVGLGVSSLPFQPDMNRLMAQIASWIKRGNYTTLASFLKNVAYNPNAQGSTLAIISSNPNLWATLNINPLSKDADGNYINPFYTLFETYFVNKQGEATNG